MAKVRELPVYQAIYNYSKEIVKIKKNMSKLVRSEIGGLLLNSSLRCLKLVTYANFQSKRESALRELYFELESHWALFRLMVDTKEISVGLFNLQSEKLSDLQRQVSAWLRFEQSKKKNNL